MKLLHAPVNPNEVQANKHAGNTLYVPISHIEMLLDEVFFGLWETKDFKWQIVANEIIGSITLRVFHPVANVWIERTGASATMIRQKSGAGITEVEAKLHNALEMDFPHLKADCLVNAAKSLGNAFGRNLNRKIADVYRPLITEKAEQAGAITSGVDHDRKMSAALLVLDDKMEQAKLMDDQTENSILISRMECQTPAHVYELIEIVNQYIPESSDPKKQFEGRINNMK